MARPDIKDARREQILDAFEACVARYGVEGATLARTAEAAGLARPLIRHNIGNREKLVEALVERYVVASREAMDALVDDLPADDRAGALVDRLFDPSGADARLVQIANALIAASAEDADLAKEMQAWLDELIARIRAVFAAERPNAAPETVDAVAAGVTGIYFNVEALYPLGDVRALAVASKNAAHLLLDALETEK